MMFLAELGDKTMLSTAVLAARTRRFITVLCVSTGAFFVANVLPVYAAWILSSFISSFIRWITAALFIAMGVWFLVSKDSKRIEVSMGLLSVFIAVLLAELGDKTQLMAISCALMTGNPTLTILCGTLGYALANFIGVALARIISTKVNHGYLKLASGLIFEAIGIYLLITLLVRA